MRCLLVLLGIVCVAWADEPRLIVKPDAFATLVNPNCSHCVDEAKRRKDELKDSDPVLLWTRGKYDGGAIPVRFFLNPYRVISDTYGVFVYDPDAGFMRGFKASLDFTFHGWRNGIMVMKHKDGTLYSCLSGVAFEGPKKGERLDAWPTVVADWGWATNNYPNGVAYYMFEKYKPSELPTKANDDSIRTRPVADKKLPAEELVLGVYKGGRARPHAYRLADLAAKGEYATLKETFECGNSIVVFWDGKLKSATAYAPIAYKLAMTKELSVVGAVEANSDLLDIVADGKSTTAPYVDKKSGTRFDFAGRGIEGKYKGWTLGTYDSVMVKWFAWAADYPGTVLVQPKEPAPKVEPKPQPEPQPDAKSNIIEVAGTAEFLRATPKRFGTLKAIDTKAHTLTLQLDGETTATTWPIRPDAEIKVAGWWGRLEQFKPNGRVWVWFACDRAKKPQAILLLCDALSEQDIHGKTATLPKDYATQHEAQKATLTKQWKEHGLPGTVTFTHIAGEVEVLLDHEAMRWGRSLTYGAKVELAESMTKPSERVPAVVKSVQPCRERTRVTLVINGTDIAPFAPGLRTYLKMPTPSKDVLASQYPPDLGKKRTKDERIEWFLASIYCTCKVANDTCTGDFYTLASCNPNGCGMPNVTRRRIAELIDKGLDDKQIFDTLHAERGVLLTKPHLVP